jgi:hypothetical protein
MLTGLWLWAAGDTQGKTFLSGVTKTNQTYSYADEALALTHVDHGQCRPKCGIKDQDRLPFDKVCASLALGGRI